MADVIIATQRRIALNIFPKGETTPIMTARRKMAMYPLPLPTAVITAFQRRVNIFARPSLVVKTILRTGMNLNNRKNEVTADSSSRSLDSTGQAGSGTISNTVYLDGYPTNTPIMADVLLVRLRDRKALAWTSSNASNGKYSFKGLNPGEKYATIAFHPSDAFQPVLDSGIKPV